MSLGYNMKGKMCVIAGGKCPGFSLGEDPKFDGEPGEVERCGCPHWSHMTVERMGSTEPEMWIGCAILMMPNLMIGLTATNASCAAAVESNRNEMVKGLEGVADAIKQTPLLLNGGGPL